MFTTKRKGPAPRAVTPSQTRNKELDEFDETLLGEKSRRKLQKEIANRERATKANLIGHSDGSVTGGYGGGFEIEECAAALAQLKYA